MCVLYHYLLPLAAAFTVTFKFCCHKHAFQKEEKLTALNEGFWEVLAIVSKESSDSCLWNFKWGDSMLVRWGGGEPALRPGSGTGASCSQVDRERGRRACHRPASAWALSTGPCISLPECLHILRTLTWVFYPWVLFCAVCSFSPKASVEKMPVPLNHHCTGEAWEGPTLKPIRAGLTPAAEAPLISTAWEKPGKDPCWGPSGLASRLLQKPSVIG